MSFKFLSSANFWRSKYFLGNIGVYIYVLAYPVKMKFSSIVSWRQKAFLKIPFSPISVGQKTTTKTNRNFEAFHKSFLPTCIPFSNFMIWIKILIPWRSSPTLLCWFIWYSYLSNDEKIVNYLILKTNETILTQVSHHLYNNVGRRQTTCIF